MQSTINLAGHLTVSADTDVSGKNYETMICFSHLRWDFVYQRPQHIMSRFARQAKVYYIEEPVFDAVLPEYSITLKADGLYIVVPHLPPGSAPDSTVLLLKSLLDNFMAGININKTLFWYYTPMALQFSSHLSPAATVFDCMDELSAFQFAPPALLELETMLFSRADVVFTGGNSLYQHKKSRHQNIHLFPSSIDQEHFRKARRNIAEPADQRAIPHPRLGFAGVIDERFDIALIEAVSRQHPEWHFVLLGPVVKIDPATLPQLPNIHYLGGKGYEQLPDYLSTWDIALIPFADNASTKFISPTKTPEYLSAGLPVISTPINDVIEPYGINGMVAIVATPEEFETAAKNILQQPEKQARMLATDRFLARNSWDNTFFHMESLIVKVINRVATAASKQTSTVQA